MDLAAFFAETAASVDLMKTAEFPTFPNPAGPSGNGQVSEKQSISHLSHLSHSQSGDRGLPDAESFQAGAHVCAGAPAREYSPQGVGNVGKVGNANQNNGLSFPLDSSKLGKVGKEASPPEAVPLLAADGLALWRAGLARLVAIDPERSPREVGYRAGEWPRVYQRALAFLDEFGAQAEALGWTAPRLFGVHFEIGIVRVDCCGALVLPIGGPVRAITATEISLGHLTHREKPGQTPGPPIWEFGR
ncbi:hypothetical protein Q8W71_17595 [Methylobacterium sp. NEAU 140]|uniref:hypothetical protein n=1 Tax=Methylobacterium sp. NEAU 140 TaxID=3064945 RepID=UPI002734EAFF|nr:hypothetical protein [Methylobacterium sp. NEAU 140]MDP4024442.1 hypothetical protein [Methylobacterium sp. NEAU 140]